MQTRLHSLATISFILLAGCADNDLGIGVMDAAPSTGSGGALDGSGGTGSGGTSGPSSSGGTGGTALRPCSEATCLASLFQTCVPEGACALHGGSSPSAVFGDICYANGVTVQTVGSYIGPNTTSTVSVGRNGVRCYRIEQSIAPGASSGPYVITDGNGNEIATAVVADKVTNTVTVTCTGQSPVTVAGACLNPVNTSPTCTLDECPTSNDGGTGGVDGGAGGVDGGTAVDAGGGCDPLAPAYKAVALADILGIGKSADGTIYVVDQSGSTQRVFVSDASGTLVRQHTNGGGSEGNESGIQYIFTVTDPASPFVLEVYVPKSGAIRMGVLQGTLPDRKSFVIGQEGEELTVLASSAIANMPLRNFPGTTVAEYIATLPDGQLMLVTRPLDDVSYTDFRVFLGPVGAVAERKVSQVSRALDGGSTHVIFDLDGAQADAYFRIVVVDASFAPGPATLTVGGVTTPLTRQSTLPAATYVCL
jgi:hypothetical protein